MSYLNHQCGNHEVFFVNVRKRRQKAVPEQKNYHTITDCSSIYLG